MSPPRILEGIQDGTGLRIGIVASRFNSLIVDPLLQGALETLAEKGVRESDITVARVPGAFEIPLVASRFASSGKHDAVVCLGAVIRGETSHFEAVAGESARGIAAVARRTGVPILFGVITAETMEQAFDRAGGKLGNRGSDAAAAAVEMARLLRAVDAEGRA